jgi:hypothetical protein
MAQSLNSLKDRAGKKKKKREREREREREITIKEQNVFPCFPL